MVEPGLEETSTLQPLQSWARNGSSPLRELLEALLHGSRWKSITNSRHKLDQLFTALRDFLLLAAAENKMLNKKISQPKRDVCLQ